MSVIPVAGCVEGGGVSIIPVPGKNGGARGEVCIFPLLGSPRFPGLGFRSWTQGVESKKKEEKLTFSLRNFKKKRGSVAGIKKGFVIGTAVINTHRRARRREFEHLERMGAPPRIGCAGRAVAVDTRA